VDCDADEIVDVVTNFYSEPLKVRKVKVERKSSALPFAVSTEADAIERVNGSSQSIASD
jgi:hypothetical protein